MPIQKGIKGSKEISLGALIAKTKELGPSNYCNHMLCIITSHEIFLDFYNISPVPTGDNVEIKHMQRIILPLDLGKGVATAVANIVAGYEAENHVILPNARAAQEDDKIAIWTEVSTPPAESG